MPDELVTRLREQIPEKATELDRLDALDKRILSGPIDPWGYRRFGEAWELLDGKGRAFTDACFDKETASLIADMRNGLPAMGGLLRALVTRVAVLESDLAVERQRVAAWIRESAAEMEEAAKTFGAGGERHARAFKGQATELRLIASAIERGEHAETPAPGSEGGANGNG